MNKLVKVALVVLFVTAMTGCVNGEWKAPEQNEEEQKTTGTVKLIDFTF